VTSLYRDYSNCPKPKQALNRAAPPQSGGLKMSIHQHALVVGASGIIGNAVLKQNGAYTRDRHGDGKYPIPDSVFAQHDWIICTRPGPFTGAATF
jgi:hypothetical protein